MKKKVGKLPFLDVFVIRKDYEIKTTLHRKSTKNNIYLLWQSLPPTTWKQGMLQILVSRAFKVCYSDQHSKKEIKHLKKVLRDTNGYPNWVIERTIDKSKKSKRTGTKNSCNN